MVQELDSIDMRDVMVVDKNMSDVNMHVNLTAAILCQNDSFSILEYPLSSNGSANTYKKGRHSDSTYTSSASALWSTPQSSLDLDVLNPQSIPNDSKNRIFCDRNYDGALCWPRTLQGTNATLPCFSEFFGITYDTSKNATRSCTETGEWELTDYLNCAPLKTSATPTDESSLEITTGVYFYGYCLSISALVMAIIIFLAFKELRCLRNIIHTHLMATYILADTMWIITSTTTFTSTGQDPQIHPGKNNRVSCVTFIMLHYFHLTNFFWMFVEGLYLYVLVVQVFVSENIKLRTYAFIGWGLPLIILIAWSIAKWMAPLAISDIQSTDPEFNVSTCLWLTVSVYDWIYKAPAILVLAANILFLLQIMWVLITKLRSATNPETQQSRKAAKALLVLMPLLGITYVLILSGSKTPVYEHLRAFLISTQGFLVALLFCFFNGEVRVVLRHRWNRFRIRGYGIPCLDYHRPRHMRNNDSTTTRAEEYRLKNVNSEHI